MTIPADAAPREIVAALHREIAARSPEHANLIAAYNQIRRRPARDPRAPRPLPDPGNARHRAWSRRMAIYTAARISGRTERGAARLAGVRRVTGQQYEADMLAALAGVTP